MLLHKSEPFISPDWIFEPKMDGIRIILSKINDKVKIFTKETQTFVYLEPRIRAKVKYRNWTKNKMLRTPVFCSFIF